MSDGFAKPDTTLDRTDTGVLRSPPGSTSVPLPRALTWGAHLQEGMAHLTAGGESRLGLQSQEDRPQPRWEMREGSRQLDLGAGKGAAQPHPAAVHQVDDGSDGLSVILCHFSDARDEFEQGTFRRSWHSVFFSLPEGTAKARPRWRGAGLRAERRGVPCRIGSRSVLEGGAGPCPTDKKCHPERHGFASPPPQWRPTGGQKRFPPSGVLSARVHFPNDLAATAGRLAVNTGLEQRKFVLEFLKALEPLHGFRSGGSRMTAGLAAASASRGPSACLPSARRSPR